jgi:hypothetical protein
MFLSEGLQGRVLLLLDARSKVARSAGWFWLRVKKGRFALKVRVDWKEVLVLGRLMAFYDRLV